MKWDRSALISIVYGLFFSLYSWYIAMNPSNFGHYKGDNWSYFFKFLLISTYCFFILQGILLKSKNWGVLLLLPLCLLAATILVGLIVIWLVTWGGGNLFDPDRNDMVLGALLMLIGTYFSLRLIRPGGRRINRAGKKR